jgi:hypothetical protein
MESQQHRLCAGLLIVGDLILGERLDKTKMYIVDIRKLSKGDFEAMARRRFQDPKPKRRGKWWTLQVRRDEFVGGQLVRKKTRVRIAPAAVSEREPRKIAAEYLRPQNQGLELIGSATNFSEYVENTYKPIIMPLMANDPTPFSRRYDQLPGAGVRKAFSPRSDTSQVAAVFLRSRRIAVST